jgi:hypothetical protein
MHLRVPPGADLLLIAISSGLFVAVLTHMVVRVLGY